MAKETEVFTIRLAEADDVPVILSLIRQLAVYEKRPEDVSASEKELTYWLFERKSAEVLLAELGGVPVGYALYFPVFGSFGAKAGLYLEDMFIQDSLRGKGLGKKLMARVAATALEQGYSGMEWSCLDWNEASIGFYRHLGAAKENGRVYMSLDKAALQLLSDEKFPAQ